VRGLQERCVVDFVVDRAPMVDLLKRIVAGIRVDTRRALLANKLSALVGRSEIRDLIDVKYLLDAGENLTLGLTDAEAKAGIDPATSRARCRTFA
jgi:hypothetical protein